MSLASYSGDPGSSSAYGGGPAWRVINIAEATGPDPTGRYVTGRNVTYQMKSGYTGTVFVAAANFNRDSVAAAIAADAQNLDDVANLTSGS